MWIHPVCSSCYSILYPGRQPVRIAGEYRELKVCCRCQLITHSGIYVGADPATLACIGIHDVLWDITETGLAAATAPLPFFVLPRLGEWIRQSRGAELADTRTDLPPVGQAAELGQQPYPLPAAFRDPFEPYLPTMPGTQLEYAGHWPACRICRLLAWLHLWSLRARHARHRHP